MTSENCMVIYRAITRSNMEDKKTTEQYIKDNPIFQLIINQGI